MFDDGRVQKTQPPIVIGQCRYQPRQIDPLILSTFASSRSIAGLVPSSGPFMGLPVPDDESAVPDEFVPGAAALVPRAPLVTDI
jgi:hypothetical protein